MRISALSGLLALAGSSAALSDSSPWVLLSTSPFDVAPNPSQIQTVSEVLKYTKEYLATCPTSRYLVVTQPGANAADLSRSNGCAMPHLCRAFNDPRLRAKYTVAEVVGEVNNPGLSSYIKSACAQKNKAVSVDEISLASLSAEGRLVELVDNDGILGRSLEATAGSENYTILFFSTPAEPTYEPEFFESLHMGLKRHVQSAFPRREDTEKDWNSLPLFQKYQFFTPGIFMAIITSIILLSILGVGLRALASLEVSYGAFEKDMGPAAQKKQQ